LKGYFASIWDEKKEFACGVFEIARSAGFFPHFSAKTPVVTCDIPPNHSRHRLGASPFNRPDSLGPYFTRFVSSYGSISPKSDITPRSSRLLISKNQQSLLEYPKLVNFVEYQINIAGRCF
jgi:hypothetical protein